MNQATAKTLSYLPPVVLIAFTFLVYGDLPERLPADVYFNGERYTDLPKLYVVLILPLSLLFTLLVSKGMVHLSPQKFAMENSRKAMDIILFGVGVLMCFIHYGMLMDPGNEEFLFYFLGYGLATFLVIVGNVFGKTERNFVIGLRVPWSLASEQNWRATHRLAGRLMVFSGAVLFITNTFYSNLFLLVSIPVASVIIPVVYSYLYYAKYERQKTE